MKVWYTYDSPKTGNREVWLEKPKKYIDHGTHIAPMQFWLIQHDFQMIKLTPEKAVQLEQEYPYRRFECLGGITEIEVEEKDIIYIYDE